MNNKLYIATIFNHIQRLHILNWKGITYHIWQQYTNNIKQYLKRNSFIKSNPQSSVSSSSPATLRFALYLLLLPQNSNTPYTATPRRRFALFFFFPNTTIPQRCSPLSSSPNHEDVASRSQTIEPRSATFPPGTAPKMKILDSSNGGFRVR